jgi:hypothetical protein
MANRPLRPSRLTQRMIVEEEPCTHADLMFRQTLISVRLNRPNVAWAPPTHVATGHPQAPLPALTAYTRSPGGRRWWIMSSW